MFGRLIGMFVLCLSSMLFALSGEFITNEKGMPADKFEIAGKSCIVYVGTFSNSGKYVIEDNYLTVTYKTKKIGAEGIPYEQSTDAVFKIVGDTCLIGKTAPFTDIKYIKYNAKNAKMNSIEPFHGRNARAPVAPKIYKTFNQSGYNISITESYDKAMGGTVDGGSGYSMSQMQAMTIITLYSQSKVGLVFKDYIVDYQKIRLIADDASTDIVMPCLYVRGGNMIQKLDMMSTQEEQITYLQEISKPWGGIAYKQVTSLQSLFDKFQGASALYYLLMNNSWLYNEAFSGIKDFNPNPNYKDIKTKMQIFDNVFMNFVVCDENWQTKYWFDVIKDWNISLYRKNCQALPDSSKTAIYNVIIAK